MGKLGKKLQDMASSAIWQGAVERGEKTASDLKVKWASKSASKRLLNAMRGSQQDKWSRDAQEMFKKQQIGLRSK